MGAFLAQTNLWRPIPNTGHQQWARAIEKYGGQSVRGYAGARYRAEEDYILDLCIPASRELKSARQPREPRPTQRPPQGRPTVLDAPQPLRGDATWLYYANDIRIVEYANVVKHKPLPSVPTQPSAKPPKGQPTGALRPFPDGGASGSDPTPGKVPALRPFPQSRPAASAPDATDLKAIERSIGGPGFQEGRSPTSKADIIQKAATSDKWVIMEGMGIRLGQRVPAPELASLANVNLIEYSRDVQTSLLGQLTVPIHMTTWRIVYILPDAPDGAIPSLPSPIAGGGGEGGSNSLASAAPNFVGD